MDLHSDSFADGTIDCEIRQEGGQHLAALSWSGVPAGTASSC